MSTQQTPDEIAAAWAALPQYTRDQLQQQIARDLPDTLGAVITEVDLSELEPDEAEIVGECIAYVVLSSHHMYASCFFPRPPGALLH